MKKQNLDFDLKREYMFVLDDVTRDVGRKILDYNGHIEDTRHVRGHEESNIDILAYEWIQGALEKNFGRLPESKRFRGKYFFELHELQDFGDDSGLIIRADEIDGTTNTKRCKASEFSYTPNATVSIAICNGPGLDCVEVGSVYDMKNGCVFSGMKVDSNYVAFCDRRILDPMDFTEKKGDSSTRIMVVGYSNKERKKKAEIEQAILESDKTGKDFRIYDGSRSTSFDIISIIKNQYDAYIDPRAMWPGSGAMLYTYDVAGVLPVAMGCGLEVSDIHGNHLGKYEKKDDALTLIVARKGLSEKIGRAIAPFVQ